MSSIFSDPFFRRGTTLLNGETIEVDDAGVPIAGREVVGQVKAFQDVNPAGRGERYSNRLVYCVAARYVGATIPNALTVTGRTYVFRDGAPLTEFSALAVEADVAAGKLVGVMDEYLTGTIRQNDIVWLVVKGPTSVRKANSSSIPAQGGVELSGTAGQVGPASTGTALGVSIAGAAVATGADTLVRINKACGDI